MAQGIPPNSTSHRLRNYRSVTQLNLATPTLTGYEIELETRRDGSFWLVPIRSGVLTRRGSSRGFIDYLEGVCVTSLRNPQGTLNSSLPYNVSVEAEVRIGQRWSCIHTLSNSQGEAQFGGVPIDGVVTLIRIWEEYVD